MSDSKLRKVVMKCAGHLNHAQGAIVEFAHEEAARLVGKGWARYANEQEQAKADAEKSAAPSTAPAQIVKTKAPAVVAQGQTPAVTSETK